jgi:hypothetical protein
MSVDVSVRGDKLKNILDLVVLLGAGSHALDGMKCQTISKVHRIRMKNGQHAASHHGQHE